MQEDACRAGREFLKDTIRGRFDFSATDNEFTLYLAPVGKV